MGCQRGTRSAFTRAFWPKRELHCIFLGEKGDHYYTSNTARSTIFLSHQITIFFQENLTKNWPKVCSSYTQIRRCFYVQCIIPLVFRYLYRYSQLYLPDEECATHTKRVGDNKTVQFTTQELRRSASHWFILLNIPDTEKPIEDSLNGVSRNWATQTWP